MARGLQAAIWVVSALLAISLMAGMGFYAVAGASYAQPSDDTNRILNALETPSGSAASGQGVVESFTVGALDMLQVFWIAVTDTSEVMMLFVPYQPVAWTVEQLARIAMGLTFAQFMRGVALE